MPPRSTPIHLQPLYRAEFGFKEGDFPVAQFTGSTSIRISFHNHFRAPTADETDYVACVLERALREVQ